MASTLEQRVLDLLKEVKDTGPVAISADMADDWVNSGVRRVVGMLPDRLCTQFTDTIGDESNPIIPLSDRIVGVWRVDSTGADVPCVQASPQKRIFDTNSIHTATQFIPKYHQIEGVIYVAPTPDTGEPGKVECIVSPSVDASIEDHINGFDAPLEDAVIYFATHLGFVRTTSAAVQHMFEQLNDIEEAGYLSSFESALPTYSSPTMETFPTLSLTTLGTLPTDLTIPDLDLSGITKPSVALSSMSALPTALTIPSPDFTGIIDPSMGTIDAAPSYTSPTSFTWSDTDVNDALTKAQELIDTTTNINFEEWMGDDDVEQASVTVQGAAQEVRRANASIQVQMGKLQEFSEEAREAFQTFQAGMNTYQADIQREIQEYATEIQDYAAEVRKIMEAYTSEQQLTLQNYRTEIDKVLGEYQAASQAELNEYASDIQKYAAEVRAVVEEWTAEQQVALQDWQSRLQKALQSYQAQTQVELSEYQAQVQRILNTYRAEVQEEVGAFQAGLNKAQSYLSAAQIILQGGQQNVQLAQIATQKSMEMYKLGEQTVMNYMRARGFQIGESA